MIVRHILRLLNMISSCDGSLLYAQVLPSKLTISFRYAEVALHMAED